MLLKHDNPTVLTLSTNKHEESVVIIRIKSVTTVNAFRIQNVLC